MAIPLSNIGAFLIVVRLKMNVIRFLKARLNYRRIMLAKQRVLKQFTVPADEILHAHWPESLKDPTGFYVRCLHYFCTRLPETLREHRNYFTRQRRGFGEDPFHTMWFLLFREFKPANFLEIGVYRGQTISLMALLAKLNDVKCEVHGISPFSPAGDSVSRYRRGIDYHHDTLQNFDHFNLPHPKLLRAYSTDPQASELIASQSWDIIYIDGNHDYEIAKKDWVACAQNVRPGGLIVLDDAGLTSKYSPPIFSTGGHPGPSRIASEIDRNLFYEVLQVGHNRVFQKLP